MTMKNPPHPGLTVRYNCLEPLGLTVTQGARALGVTRQALNNLVNGKSGISPDMAIRLSKAFGASPETWLKMQLDYDLAQARLHEDRIQVTRVHRNAGDRLDLDLFSPTHERGDKMSENTQPDDFVSLYRGAFKEFSGRALWNVRELEDPNPEDAMVVARCLRIEGNLAARRLAERIERACHAAH